MLRIIRESKIAKNIKGAALVYVSLMMALLMGMAGVAIDMSRLATSHSQAQFAADAAALAAARQLDGSVKSIERADEAAQAALLIANSQQFSSEEDGVPNVQITMRYLTDLPPLDDTAIPYDSPLYTTDPKLAYFAEATTEILTHENLLLPALGVAMSKQFTTVAIAGQDASVCKITPFAICNPSETATNLGFNYLEWKGKLIRVVEGGGGKWAPGNFGFLDPPNLGTGAGDVAEFLAQVDPNNQCYSARLNTRPGAVTSTRGAINTRFDIYDGAFFHLNGNGMGNPNDPRKLYPPAQNVTRGWVEVSPGMGNGGTNGNNTTNTACEVDVDTSGNTMGLPVDTNQDGIDNATGLPNAYELDQRFGDGKWDCKDYWDINHPDMTTSELHSIHGVTCANDSADVSRYEIYKLEIEEEMIPGSATGHTDEEGYPQCSSHAPARDAPYDIETDRRVIQFAIMNCEAENVVGNADNVAAVAFVRAFLTQPIEAANAYDVYLEVIDVVEAGVNNGPLKEYVEIYR